MNQLQRILILVSVVTMLSGCSSTNAKPDEENARVNAPVPLGTVDPAQTQLAEAATSVSQSLYHLAAIEQAAYPPKIQPLPSPTTAGMTQLVSVDWNGPVKQLVQHIANISGYKLEVLGIPPAIPAIVTINEYNKPLAEVLRNVAYQTGNKALIRVLSSSRTIQIRYDES